MEVSQKRGLERRVMTGIIQGWCGVLSKSYRSYFDTPWRMARSCPCSSSSATQARPEHQMYAMHIFKPFALLIDLVSS